MRARRSLFYLAAVGSTLGAAVQGAGLVFGPHQWRTAGSYAVLSRQLPMRLWGVVFLLVALVFLYGLTIDWRATRVAAVACLVAVTIWLVSFIIAAITGKLTGVPASWVVWAFTLYVQATAPRSFTSRLGEPGSR